MVSRRFFLSGAVAAVGALTLPMPTMASTDRLMSSTADGALFPLNYENNIGYYLAIVGGSTKARADRLLLREYSRIVQDPSQPTGFAVGVAGDMDFSLKIDSGRIGDVYVMNARINPYTDRHLDDPQLAFRALLRIDPDYLVVQDLHTYDNEKFLSEAFLTGHTVVSGATGHNKLELFSNVMNALNPFFDKDDMKRVFVSFDGMDVSEEFRAYYFGNRPKLNGSKFRQSGFQMAQKHVVSTDT